MTVRNFEPAKVKRVIWWVEIESPVNTGGSVDFVFSGATVNCCFQSTSDSLRPPQGSRCKLGVKCGFYHFVRNSEAFSRWWMLTEKKGEIRNVEKDERCFDARDKIFPLPPFCYETHRLPNSTKSANAPRGPDHEFIVWCVLTCPSEKLVKTFCLYIFWLIAFDSTWSSF